MVQRKLSDNVITTSSTPNNQEPMRIVKQRRSFTPVLQEIAPYYANKERTNPQINPDVERNINIIDQLISKKTEMLWCLGRYICMKEGKEMTPNWTGFHYEVTSKLNNDIDEVFYLPTINQSPTRLETGHEVLYQMKSKSQAIGLHCSDLVLDHAIYSKALEILQNPNYTDLKQFINLRLGGFHVCLNFLAVIGSHALLQLECGCDSTSSMCGIGKVKRYRMIEEDDTYLLYMSEQTEKLLEVSVSFVWKFNGR